jgi:hypothetical protein
LKQPHHFSTEEKGRYNKKKRLKMGRRDGTILTNEHLDIYSEYAKANHRFKRVF